MTEPIAYLNGNLVAASDLSVSILDTGFVMGVTVSERLRTFGGKLFRMVEHLRRLRRSLEIIGLAADVSLPDLAIVSEQLVAHNLRAHQPGDDLGVCIFVTPGTGGSQPNQVTSCIYTYPLPFHNWVNDYTAGTTLVVSQVRQVPASCWPPELKCRSRMHYYLADQEAARTLPGARALLLDEDGMVSEASTANIVVYRAQEGLISPKREKILPGISVAVLRELADGMSIPFVERDIDSGELASADEMMLCSTSPCVWPVHQVNSDLIGDGRPGPMLEQLLLAWDQLVGFDIRDQARRFANRAY